MNFFWGIVFGLFGQVISFMQLQGGIKWGWTEKYLWLVLLVSIPSTLLYIKSVENFITYFNGTLWESRFLGFAIGIIVFAFMSYILFKEPFTPKVLVSMILAVLIISVQIFMK
jgi:multidrug transporter EmrE-like cation transporter